MSGDKLYRALAHVYRGRRFKWWSPSDIEDRKALRRIANDPVLLDEIAAAFDPPEKAQDHPRQHEGVEP